MSNSIMLEMTIANNGPVHFDDFVYEINSELHNAVSNFDLNSYNEIVKEMAEFGIKPEFILDAPNGIELPNHALAHRPAFDKEEIDNSEIVEMDKVDAIMDRINSQFPDNDEIDNSECCTHEELCEECENSEMTESDMDSALLDF